MANPINSDVNAYTRPRLLDSISNIGSNTPEHDQHGQSADSPTSSTSNNALSPEKKRACLGDLDHYLALIQSRLRRSRQAQHQAMTEGSQMLSLAIPPNIKERVHSALCSKVRFEEANSDQLQVQLKLLHKIRDQARKWAAAQDEATAEVLRNTIAGLTAELWPALRDELYFDVTRRGIEKTINNFRNKGWLKAEPPGIPIDNGTKKGTLLPMEPDESLLPFMAPDPLQWLEQMRAKPDGGEQLMKSGNKRLQPPLKEDEDEEEQENDNDKDEDDDDEDDDDDEACDAALSDEDVESDFSIDNSVTGRVSMPWRRRRLSSLAAQARCDTMRIPVLCDEHRGEHRYSLEGLADRLRKRAYCPRCSWKCEEPDPFEQKWIEKYREVREKRRQRDWKHPLSLGQSSPLRTTIAAPETPETPEPVQVADTTTERPGDALDDEDEL